MIYDVRLRHKGEFLRPVVGSVVVESLSGLMSPKQPAPPNETQTWMGEQDEAAVRDLTGMTLKDFRVERLIGRGGMGEVYLATQASLNRPVALKVLRPRAMSRPGSLSRFEAEAAAVAKLNHPNIVHVYTLDRFDGIHYIAMEYVEGTNLRDFILRKGALDLALACSFMKQAGMAIQAAGEVGLIHRDIKPENLLLTRKGRVKVADFGLCRDLDSDRHHVTQPGVTMGTPLYMSPEQAQGHALDHRSDLYSLGVTFYHMLAGEPPFRADSAVAVALKHVKDQPASLQIHRPDIPPELDRFVLKLMAKSPAERYQSAAEMLSDLAKIRGTLQIGPGQPAMAMGSSGSISTDWTATPTPYTPPQVTIPDSASSVSGVSAPGPVVNALGQVRLTSIPIGVLTLIMFATGLGAGWLTRSTSLASPNDATARSFPGSTLEPEWRSIPKQDNAELQYRFALLQAAPDEIEAAWLAVPGNFEKSHDWSSPAYLQLARHLYRDRDREKLATLASELAQWSTAQARDQDLVGLLEASVKMLDRDLAGVSQSMARFLEPNQHKVLDPGILQLGSEVMNDALRVASLPGNSLVIRKQDLVLLQARLIAMLHRVKSGEQGMNGWAG